jgi:hypothetical protein
MTYYIVTVWRGSEMVRELWSEIEKRGNSIIAAELYIQQLKRLFPNFGYTVRPVTDQESKEWMNS